MYGFESWTFDTQKSRDQLHAGIIKLYKRLLGSNHAAHLTDDEVIVSAGLPSPTELLRGCRLRYFGTLYRCGRAAHWGLLCEDTAWIAMLEDDLLWLWQQLQNNTNLPDPRMHFPMWNDILLHHGGYWKNSSRRAWLMLAFNEKMKQLRFNFTAGLQSSYISKAGSLTFPHLLALMRNRRQYLGACTAKRFMHRKLGKARTCLKGTGFVHQPVNFLKTLLAPIACVNITPVQKCLPSSTCAPVSTEPPGPTSEV